MDKDLDIDKIVFALKQNLEVKDRRYRLKMYEKCFVAAEAVDFLVESDICPTREAAVELGKYLQGQKGLFRHVTGEHCK